MKNLEIQGQTLTSIDTGMVKDIQVQTGTHMGRQGQKGTDRDKQGHTRTYQQYAQIVSFD